MSVSAITSAGSYQTTDNSEARSIQQQIADLQKKMIEVQNNDELDEKTKAEQVAVYQTQISQLQAQLAKSGQSSAAAQAGHAAQADSEADPYENRATGMMGLGQYLDQGA